MTQLYKPRTRIAKPITPSMISDRLSAISLTLAAIRSDTRKQISALNLERSALKARLKRMPPQTGDGVNAFIEGDTYDE